MKIHQNTLEANDMTFAYLEAGEGPLVLLLHGFPDNAWTWSAQFPALAEAGYRVVAPFQRGYAPSEIPSDAKYDLRTFGRDLVEWVAVLNDGNPTYVVGHDIGALQLSAAIGESPDSFRRPVWLAGTHPMTFSVIGLTPRLAHNGFHLWLLALPSINNIVAAHDDMALIDYLWDHWSPDGADYAEHLAQVKRETLSKEGSLEAGVAIYPHLVPGDGTGAHEEMLKPVPLPSLLIHGSEDPAPHTITVGEEQHYTAGMRREVVDGAKHWPHRERPERVNELLLEWFGGADAPLSQADVAGAGAR